MRSQLIPLSQGTARRPNLSVGKLNLSASADFLVAQAQVAKCQNHTLRARQALLLMLEHEEQMAMKMPGPATTCLLIATIGGAALWLLGETTAAIAVFLIEGIAWAAVHVFGSSKSE